MSTKVIKCEKTNQDIPTQKFNITIPNTQIQITKEISLVKDYNDDIIKFLSEFNKISLLANWNEEIRLQIIRLLIPESLDISSSDTTQTITEKLLLAAYPKNKYHHFQEQAEKCYQNNFIFIKDYIKKINSWLEILAFSGELNKAEQKRKFEELFFKNLSTETKEIIVTQSLNGFENLVKYIESIENMLVETKVETEIVTNYTKGNFKTNYKYCRYHKTNTHNSEQCLKLKQFNNQQNKPSNANITDTKPDCSNIIHEKPFIYFLK